MSEPKEGTVVAEGGKFFLDVAGNRLELVPQLAGGAENLRAIAGQRVEILYSEATRFVAGLQVGRRPPIICYVPPVVFGQQGFTLSSEGPGWGTGSELP